MNKEKKTHFSKLMSKMLRHSPEQFGLKLDPTDGSCETNELLEVVREQPKWSDITINELSEVVADCEKQRFEINGDRIRARYGHSHDKVSYPAAVPPTQLFHGTNVVAAPTILKVGIQAMQRQYVHMSEGLHFATLAGRRRGELVIIAIDAEQAAEAGVIFYYAGNEVWLATHIPAVFCSMYTPKLGGDQP
ncbi:RNA 2'-phosphotransferase [Paenibacillus sp. N3.4]|uniref:RNA 2'-phosphotransferase n=1 Tax=Paenibacillus sp. N3.4 TaxID=2603222 RepID=UPI0011C83286|nr:RNA 2'-phosphotransferase [Paenibacillus sp. N3.4]TXK80026.1 RNA 2'-phosphotransferase [Paenibacillus sp. N3.4]